MSNLAVYKLQILEEFSKRMPKRLSWQKNHQTDLGYNKALNAVRKVLREMMKELS